MDIEFDRMIYLADVKDVSNLTTPYCDDEQCQASNSIRSIYMDMGRSWWVDFLPTLLGRFPNITSLYLKCNYISPYENRMFPFCQLPKSLERLYLDSCQDHVDLSDVHLLPNLKLVALYNHICSRPNLCTVDTVILSYETPELEANGRYKLLPNLKIDGIQRLMHFHHANYYVYHKKGCTSLPKCGT